MCGIAGVFNGSEGVDAGTLEAMNDCLVHRGPDEAGVYVDGAVGLAHRRLAIIDPVGGSQPLFNEDGSVAVVYNGEVYNHRSLREDLEAAGHRFDSDADTEVLVHGYEEWGDAVVERLEGMFAFALWDADAERLLVARDPMGIKPLLLADDGEAVAVASELSALFESPVAPGGVDDEAIALYFGFGFVPAPRTAFENVEKLRPGERAVVTADGVGRERYYRPRIARRDPGMEAAAAEIRRRVTDAVEKRLMSDVPLGAFLSGGIDSSIVVGTMAALGDEPVRTFTVGFEEALFDESPAARTVAEHHDTDHDEVTVSPADVRALIPEVVDGLGEPFADPSLLPTAVVARETSRDVTVALSGDGADELFAGYDKYLGERYSRYYRALPGPARAVVGRAVNALPVDRRTRVGDRLRQARKFLRGGEPDLVARHYEWLRPADAAALGAIGGAVDPATAARRELASEHEAARTSLPGAGEFSRMLAVDAGYVLPNQMLAKVDLAGMHSSLEVRVPFLDRAVVEYAQSLPAEYKMRGRARKRVLRRAFADVLPAAVQERPKRGFDVPIGEWFKGPLREEFESVLGSIETAAIDTDAVGRRFGEHCAGRREHARFLWSVYVYGRWERRMRERGVLAG